MAMYELKVSCCRASHHFLLASFELVIQDSGRAGIDAVLIYKTGSVSPYEAYYCVLFWFAFCWMSSVEGMMLCL